MKTITIQNDSDVELHGVPPGGRKPVAVDKEGTPLDRDWRRRLNDAKIDACVSIVDDRETAVAPEPENHDAPQAETHDGARTRRTRKG